MLEQLKFLISYAILIPMVLSVGIFFTYKLRFIQFTHIRRAWSLFINDRNPNKKSSSFSAVAAVLGGNLGTGNIAGIAVALATGGPGALVWMWVLALCGSILKFTGTVLAILHRKKDERSEYVGGPMYYMRDALKSPKLAVFYCLFTILSAITVGNMVQINSLALPLYDLGVPHGFTGILMAILVGSVIMGGLKRFSQVVSMVVPFMALLYVASCVCILAINAHALGPALSLIFESAFSPLPIAGGIAGFAVFEAMQAGFDRGLFATDVGVGLAPIIHSSVESNTSRLKTAVTQGLISTLSPVIVMVVCTMTGLVLIVTQAWLLEGYESTNVCIEAFKIGLGSWAGHIVTFTLFFFAFTTILTWSFCADKAIEFLFNTRSIKYFQFLFIALIPFGAMFKVNIIWSTADIFMNGMMIMNVSALVFLFPQILKKVRGILLRKHMAKISTCPNLKLKDKWI